MKIRLNAKTNLYNEFDNHNFRLYTELRIFMVDILTDRPKKTYYKKNITNWFLEILVTFRKERMSFTPRIKQSTRTALRGLG